MISDLGSGGAQRVLLHLVEAWHRKGRRITVITLAGPEQDFFRLPNGVRRIAIGGVANSRSLLAGLLANGGRVWRLRRALREANAPIAIAFVAQSAVLTVLASIGLPLRVVASERNDPRHQTLGPIWNQLRRFAYRRADLVTANSRGVVEALAEFVPRDRLAFLPNPLPSPPTCEPAQLAAPTILSIGRLNHQKAHDVLLRAFAHFAAKQPDWRLAIMGEGPEEMGLRELASRLGIADKVDWLGRRDNPYPFLRACRMFVLASRHEGMPNALLEAMSCARALHRQRQLAGSTGACARRCQWSGRAGRRCRGAGGRNRTSRRQSVICRGAWQASPGDRQNPCSGCCFEGLGRGPRTNVSASALTRLGRDASRVRQYR